MTQYTYTQRNLFDAPEYYHYAECRQVGYLDAWRESRRAFVAKLIRARTDAIVPTSRDAEFLEAHLARLVVEISEGGGFSPAAADTVSRLVHKYEVSRRLYQRYTDDWRRLEGASEAGLQTYLLFAELLVLHCNYYPRDRQKLSTLLKLCDALASLDVATYTVGQSQVLEGIIVGECELVNQLVGGVDDLG